MLEKIEKFRAWLNEIEQHYNDVQKAWGLIKDKCKDMPFMADDFIYFTIDQNVKIHDLSKLSVNEFTQYRQYFHPCKDEKKDKQLFKSAWNHHKEHNRHHWETWTSSPILHDIVYVIENVIDWVAMGFVEGKINAKEFYEKNKHKIDIPDWAVGIMYKIFDRIYNDDPIKGYINSIGLDFPTNEEELNAHEKAVK